MIEITTLFLLISFLFYLFNIFCLKKNYLIDQQSQSSHKTFTNQVKVPITGGIFIIILIFFFFKDLEIIDRIIFFLVFFTGLLSDTNKLSSPKIRFLFQLLIVIFFIIVNNLYINEIRIDFLDKILLNNNLLRIIFTTFCILILINGSNFMDGVNTLNSGYFLIIFVNIIILSSKSEITVELYNLKLISLILFIFIIFNSFNKSFLGDSGSYLIAFYAAIFFINFSNQNELISPYYVAVLLWYPAFENFFSLTRRLIFEKKKVKNADNLHIHHLLFLFIKKKLSNSKHTNIITGLTINIFNIFIVLIANNYLYQTKILILILVLSILTYIVTYFLLKKNVI